MLTRFGGGQDPDHAISRVAQCGEVAEEHFMVAKAIGGHQAIGQSPAWIGNPQDALENLLVAGELAEAGSMQAIAGCLCSPVLGQFQFKMPGQAAQGCAALLATAASIGVAVQGLKQQLGADSPRVLAGQSAQSSQIGVVGTCPCGSTASR